MQRRGGAEEGGQRERTIAVLMTTVMCMPSSRPSQKIQAPSFTCTRDVIVHTADRASQTRTSAHPIVTPPPSKNSAFRGLSLAQGARTPMTIDSVSQTIVTELYPRRRLPPSHRHSIGYRAPCAWRIAGINECTSRRHPQRQKIHAFDALAVVQGGMRPDHPREGRIAANSRQSIR